MKVTCEELDDLYNRQRLSMKDIATQLGVTSATIRNWMIACGLSRRSKSESRRKPLDDEEIARLYVKEQCTLAEIAQELGADDGTIRQRLVRMGVPRNSRSKAYTLLDDNEIKYMYVVERHTMTEIAQKLGVSAPTIRQRLITQGVPLRSKSENLRLPLNEDEIIRLYIEERKSSTEIAQQFGVDRSVILDRLEARGIPRRTSGETQQLPLDENEIVRQYIEERKSTCEIARQLGTNDVTILKRLKKQGVERRNRSEAIIAYERHDFFGDLLEKAYLQGFRYGDLTVKKATEGPGCATLVVTGSTTRIAQINLYNELFSPYAQVGIIHGQDGRHHFWCDLNMSFEFLLLKQDSIPVWVLHAAQKDGNFNPLIAFVAGYTDAEGCFYVKSNGCSAFELRAYDEIILRQLHVAFNDWLNIQCPPIRLDKPKGTPLKGTPYVTSGNCWGLHLYRKASLHRLCELLEPYLKHADRRQAMYAVWANVQARGV